MSKAVPFYSQIVNWQGEDSGFPNDEQIALWENNCCGIACLRMILDYYESFDTGPKPSYWDLLQMGLRMGGYVERGWIHAKLLAMANTYGIKGECHRGADLTHLMASIERHSICIVSVATYFRGGDTDNDGHIITPGGHLVVAYDTQQDSDGETRILCNHPSSYGPRNVAAWAVGRDKWEKSFSGNYIEFWAR